MTRNIYDPFFSLHFSLSYFHMLKLWAVPRAVYPAAIQNTQKKQLLRVLPFHGRACWGRWPVAPAHRWRRAGTSPGPPAAPPWLSPGESDWHTWPACSAGWSWPGRWPRWTLATWSAAVSERQASDLASESLHVCAVCVSGAVKAQSFMWKCSCSICKFSFIDTTHSVQVTCFVEWLMAQVDICYV